MSFSVPSEIDAAYAAYFSGASKAELAEDAEWAEFAMLQFAALCSDEDSID